MVCLGFWGFVCLGLFCYGFLFVWVFVVCFVFVLFCFLITCGSTSCHMQLNKCFTMHFQWILNAAFAVVQWGLMLCDFQSPRGSLIAGEGMIQDGRWNTHSCVGDLWIKKGASVTQSIKASPRLSISGSGASTRCSWKRVRLTAPRGISHVTLCPPRLDVVLSDWKEPTPFHHLSDAGVLAASQGFLLWPLLLTQTLEGPVILAVGQRCLGSSCNTKGTVNFTGFVSTERQPDSWKRKGVPAGSVEGCCTEH